MGATRAEACGPAARPSRHLTQRELAIRAGVSTRTVASIEAASPNTAAGLVFAVALAAGVDLFGADTADTRANLAHQAQAILALLPERVRRVTPTSVPPCHEH
jgi:transcriptional regulator with XRE-family HTH domain